MKNFVLKAINLFAFLSFLVAFVALFVAQEWEQNPKRALASSQRPCP